MSTLAIPLREELPQPNRQGNYRGLGPKITVWERFWTKVERTGADECWAWTAWCDKDGYATFTIDEKPVRAARFLLQMLGNDMADDQLACHSCDNPGCVNPAHLWVGTHSENVRDAVAKGRWTQAHHNFPRGRATDAPRDESGRYTCAS